MLGLTVCGGAARAADFPNVVVTGDLVVTSGSNHEDWTGAAAVGGAGSGRTVAGNLEIYGPTANGAACAANVDCRSRLCVGGTCRASQCTSGTCCDVATQQYRPSTYRCRESTGECDPADYCTGSSATCVDAWATEFSPCSTDGNPCTKDECRNGVCTHYAGNQGAVCRAKGECHAADATCNGVNAECPANPPAPEGTLCADTVDNCYTAACSAGTCNQTYGTCTYSIAGVVSNGGMGTRVTAVPQPPGSCAGVGCTCPAGQPTTQSAIADLSGAYRITGLGDCIRNYVVTPTRTGCTYSPTSATVTAGPNKSGVSFYASCPLTYYLSGNAGAPGVTVTATRSGFTESTLSAADGSYILYLPANYTYTVTPARGGCSFNPTFTSVSLSSHKTGINFGPTCVPVYAISGSTGVPFVTVTAGSFSTVSGADGSYSLPYMPAGTYTVTPARSGYSFGPASLSVTVGPNATGKNFTAYQCGDGTKNGSEQCDDGANNGAATSCCTAACAYKAQGAECGAGVCDQCNASGTCVASDTACFVERYHYTDLVGSVVATADASGTVLCREVYRPFGAEHSATGSCAALKFNGRELDVGTGLVYYGGRYYDPLTGRFISFDTVVGKLRNPQSFNRYAYVLNNPYKYTDPTGHEPQYTGWDYLKAWVSNGQQQSAAREAKEQARVDGKISRNRSVIGTTTGTDWKSEERGLWSSWLPEEYRRTNRDAGKHDVHMEWFMGYTGARHGFDGAVTTVWNLLTAVFMVGPSMIDEGFAHGERYVLSLLGSVVSVGVSVYGSRGVPAPAASPPAARREDK
jgi:RHS repeat-associated protein